MPRNLAGKKGHSNRHDNGLVGPGKRVSKQKSNGHLNGSAKPSPPADEPVPNVPKSYLCADDTATSTGVEPETNTDQAATLEEMRWRKRDSESSSDFQGQNWDNANGTTTDPSTRRNERAATNTRGLQDVSAIQLASTILSSNPIGDTISLLIVLLALPSMVLTLVQALFASLTLIPPSTGISTPFLGLFDVFQGSAGSPSLTTMAVMDVICFALWVGLWNWAQNFALDLAQIQIAVTFGCGNYGKGGSVNTVCFLLVLLLHSVRSSGLRRLVHTKVLPESVLSHPRFAAVFRYLPAESDFGSGPIAPSKLRSLFAVHIISQALMAFVRRRVAGTSSANKAKRLESESLAGGTVALDSSAQDSVFNTAASTSGNDQLPPPTPTVRDTRDRLLTAKKRRRQANQVKSRQPFWAALASTKVHVLREVEHSKDKVNPTTSQEYQTRGDCAECVTITTVEPTTIHFEAGNCTASEGHDTHNSGSIKPFYVRVNGARWQQVNMDWTDEDVSEDGYPTRLTGSIAGLAPDCTYTCTFILADGEELMASIMVRTPALLDRDQPNTTVPAPVRQSARPNSPTTTLKTSIHTAERSREDATEKRNKKRRNHKAALQKMDGDNDKTHNKLKSSGDDSKLKTKLMQAERNSQQHKEVMASIDNQLQELETIPEDESDQYDKKKGAYDEQTKYLSETHKSLSEAKSQTNTELREAKNDQSNTTGRKDRLGTKNAKLAAEQERLTQANIQNLSEKERKAVESVARESDQQRQIADWQRRISDMSAQLNTIKMQTQNAFREAEDVSNRTVGPLTPEGELPGTLPRGPRNLFFGSMHASTFVPDPEASPFQSFARPQPIAFGRPRSGTNQSTGAMSGVSGGDFDDPDPIPPMPNNMDFDMGYAMNGRRGSGSSRGKNNHSPAMAGPGVIGGGYRNPQKGNYSPGHAVQVVPSTNTW